jgi:hypothetical protein
MSGFTKLVPEIVNSSIWNESAEIRCVWIAMLATKDERGYIRGNVASMARTANVSIDSAREAITKFQQPDAESNTPDNDGRRIQAVPGGWFVLNHALYRGKDYREYEAERKKEYRDKHKMSGTCPGQVPDSSVSASASASDSKGGEGGKQEEPAFGKRGELLPFGEFNRVKLSNEEYNKLALEYSGRIDQAIEMLDAYIEQSGKKYKNHYAVMKKNGWVWDKVHGSNGKPIKKPRVI